MGTFKKLLIFILVGTVVGDIASMLIAPTMLEWYASPAAGQALCDCVMLVRGTTHRFVQAQVAGAASGAVLFLIVGIIFLRIRAKRARTAAAQVTPTRS
jgi:hypothetical protein